MDLHDLYRDVIVDHNRNPRNFRPMPDADSHAEGFNPLCGDRLTVYVRLEDDVIRDVSFQGSGCAISKASASVMTGVVKGKTREEIDAIFEKFHRLVTEGAAAGAAEDLGKLAVFGGVHEYPTRVKCASLAWHALRAAISGAQEPVSTE